MTTKIASVSKASTAFIAGGGGGGGEGEGGGGGDRRQRGSFLMSPVNTVRQGFLGGTIHDSFMRKCTRGVVLLEHRDILLYTHAEKGL